MWAHSSDEYTALITYIMARMIFAALKLVLAWSVCELTVDPIPGSRVEWQWPSRFYFPE